MGAIRPRSSSNLRRIVAPSNGRAIASGTITNQHRPHEALGQQTPTRGYHPSPRSWPPELLALRYPKSWPVRRVRPHGDIKWQGRLRFVGRAFVGETLGLKPIAPHQCAVYLGTLLIGELRAADPAGMRPARWQRLPSQPLQL